MGPIITIKDLLIKHKNNYTIAITYGAKKITYNELFERVNQTVNFLNPVVKNLNNIGILLPNSINYVVSYFSITFMDKVIVPLEIKSKKFEMVGIIKYCDVNLIITNSYFKSMLKVFFAEVNYSVVIFNLDDSTFEKIGQNDKLSNGKHFDGVALLLHTSGSSSSPKRVMLTHKNLISNIESNIISLGIKKKDTTLICLPMIFSYCNTAQFLSHIYVGAHLVIMDSMFMPKKIFKLVEQERITNFLIIPSLVKTLLPHKKLKYTDLSSLKWICIGGSHISDEILKSLIEHFYPIQFVKTYGLTEASPRVTTLLPKDMRRKISSIGKPISGVKVRIIDENDENVEVGDPGEIIIQGDNVMLGYYKREEETLKVKKDNWLYTGDIGAYDKEGFVYLIGRKKSIIICNGINIYPEEIEEILMTHPMIEKAYVYGKQHELLGEVPVAKVVTKDINNIDEKELRRYCLTRLSDYKMLAEIFFVNELPSTSSGKLKRLS